jgi:trans-aconitate 2-methyltransferase
MTWAAAPLADPDLAQRWPDAQVSGIDDSAPMLAKRLSSRGRSWVPPELANWAAPQPADLIYSNAALHWLPAHAALFRADAPAGPPRACSRADAAQLRRPRTPRAETVLDGPWRAQLEPLLAPPPVAEPAHYFEWLEPHAEQLDIWETEYLQVLTGRDAVKEWTKGTWLKQFLDALPEPMRTDFEAAYARRVGLAYPPRADGRTLFPFRRLFIVARRR